MKRLNVSAYSLYWDNIDPALVAAQRSVFERFQIPINQHRIDHLEHGEWIDWTMKRQEQVDVFLFIDIDCVPLSPERVAEGVDRAARGVLFGAEGAANHIQPLRSYAGAWYVYVNRKRWQAFSCPSARATPHADVCQGWTDTWRAQGVAVQLIAPTACVEPRWDLPERPRSYGVGTTYGEHCYHLFEARAGHRKLFLDRCREITASAENPRK
jgi:hypothetical protein